MEAGRALWRLRLEKAWHEQGLCFKDLPSSKTSAESLELAGSGPAPPASLDPSWPQIPSPVAVGEDSREGGKAAPARWRELSRLKPGVESTKRFPPAKSSTGSTVPGFSLSSRSY